MKVLIIGGMGYIGTELQALYEVGDNVTILDNRFVPHKVGRHNFKFIEADITDEEAMKRIIPEYDLIYLLAAFTGTKSSKNFEVDIMRTNYQGSLNVIDNMKDDARIIFSSTANIFGGYDEILNANESIKSNPRFPYAETKVVIEEYLKISGCNYIICRFGANYGINDQTRLSLVGNTFAKITAQDGEIKLMGGGNNYRPFTCVHDSARALKHLGENKMLNKEIFHCNGENFKIKEIADMCKKINDKIKIITVEEDNPPFGSYSLDNTKLLRTGFVFYYNLKDEIKIMIGGYDNVT